MCLHLGLGAGVGALIGLAEGAGGSSGALSPTTTIVLALITTAGGLGAAAIARLPLGRRKRNRRPDDDGDDDQASGQTIPIEAYNAMVHQLQAEIDDLRAQLRRRLR